MSAHQTNPAINQPLGTFDALHMLTMTSLSPQMGDVSRILRKFAVTDAPILITGESGTGKEVSARAIHAACRRRTGPFTAVNCAALPADLIASELFGYEKGAFTGAATRKIGQIEHANGGTLFLDEIGDMPVDLQSHLLRFLQEGKIVRVGGRGDAIPVNVRIIAATNVDLNAAMHEGRFREDLFYRLNVLSLHMPPLRDRAGDLEPLAYRFLIESSEQVGREVHAISSEAMTALMGHDWPGNVRELKSAIFRAVVMCSGGVIQVDDLSLTPSRRRPLAVNLNPGTAVKTILPRAAAIGRESLIECLVRNRQNVTATSHELQVSRVTLYRLLRRFDITLDRRAAE